MKRLIIILAGLIMPAFSAFAEDPSSYVRLPLNDYNRLNDTARDPKKEPRKPPAPFALNNAAVRLTASEQGERIKADVKISLNISVFENEWTAVPILPAKTPVESAAVAGKQAELIPAPDGVFWGTKAAGSYLMELSYQIDALRTDAGFSLAIPVPEAAAISLDASMPKGIINPVIIPAAGMEINENPAGTKVTATIPTTAGFQLSWRVPGKEGHSLGRAVYKALLQEDKGNSENEALLFNGEFNVTLSNNEPYKLKLLPVSSTLNDVRVDDKTAALNIEDDYFVTVIKGAGTHKVALDFQVAVNRTEGPPKTRVEIPQIPISRFELTLPGKKELSVEPKTPVARKEEGDKTLSTFFVPMTSEVALSWTEAVPEEVKTEVRTNASFYHTVYAEEGVLYVHGLGIYEITRGETNLLEFESPSSMQINRITSAAGGIADWRVTSHGEGKPDTVSLFLDRKVSGEITFDVYGDRSIVGVKDSVPIPLLRAVNVQRQRGMVALLSSKELTLKPLEEGNLTRVGENQLPAFVRQTIDKTVAHTYKYVEDAPLLTAQAVKPDRVQGKFDALVSTLVSLSDVTMKGSATVEVNVKSGTIDELVFELPAGLNVLSLTGPSIRTHKVNPGDNKQTIDIQFTQDMEGQFRIEVAYEKIVADTEAELAVPTLAVKGAEIEQGRIAVEALSAVEVQSSSVAQLSSLDPSELPQQLVLKTTNPILLAYKYAHVDPPYHLGLKITRHKEIDTQAATIDQAVYRTLYTKDGLAVTAATFTVRNSRQQFLRVELPEGSKVWSAFVDGKPEKPALGDDKKKEGPSVLIKIINSAQGFPVTLVYQTPVSEIGALGFVTALLPKPDMVVTNTHWDVYVPADVAYGKADTNMTVVKKGIPMSPYAMKEEMSRLAGGQGSAAITGPLQISVPATGILYAFEKLYANQAAEGAYFAVPYASGGGELFVHLVVLLGTALLWLGLAIAFRSAGKSALKPAITAFGAGIVLLWLFISHYGASQTPAVLVSLLVLTALAAAQVMKFRERRRSVPSIVEAENRPAE